MAYKSSNPILVVIKAEWQNLGNKKTRYIIHTLLFIIAGLIGLLTPWLIGTIFNTIQSGEIKTITELRKLFIMFSLLIVIKIVFWLFHGVARISEQLVAFDVHKNYANKKIKQTLELPVKWHKDNHSGDTIDRINKARLALYQYSQHEGFQLIYIILEIFGSLGIIFFINVKIGLFALIFCLVVLSITIALDKKVKSIYKIINWHGHKLSASIFDYFSNIITIITLRLKNTVRDNIEEKIQEPYEYCKKEALMNEAKWAISNTAITVMTVIILIYQANTSFKETGLILIGTLYMLYSYLERVGNAFFKFAQFYGSRTKSAARIESAEPINKAFEEVKTQLKTHLPKKWQTIQIKNLNFTYNQEGNIKHLDDINLSFKRGEKIALIGESGSGKSTILSLLRGLYLPQSADISCDNKPLKYGIQTLKQSVTLIPQDPEIFNETIFYNITMDMFSNKKDLQKVIQMAQFETVINRLPKGIETSVKEKGVSLSGGEKQRLALARGILAAKDSDIVLLDEPTSSVDSINERKIHENIFSEFKNKTIISSIHRLHLLDKFNKIIILDQGKIVAQGTFKEIQNNPIFKQIWKKYLGSTKK